MQFDTIKKYYKRLSLLPFAQEGDVYFVEMDSLKRTDEELEKYCKAFEEALASATFQTNHPYLEDTIKQLRTAYETFKKDLATLQIPVEEVRTYQKRNVKGESIQQYDRIKKRLKYAMVPLLHQYHGGYHGDPYLLNDSERDRLKSHRHRKTVLNHNNPFSDITIGNQSFIYQGDDGKYKTLQFRTGYTMSKMEEETTSAIVLQPDFKITKTEDRESKINEITMDDTITTRLPDKTGDKELVYM